MKVPLALLAATLLFPMAASQSGWILGTEELPELPAAGPVTYGPLYGGPQDHEYLRILAGWFGYENVTDTVVWNLKITDATKITRVRSDWSVSCVMRGNLTTDGAIVGNLAYAWGQRPNGSTSHGVRYSPGDSSAVSESVQARELPHEFLIRIEAPGYLRFDVNRTTLLQLGDQLQDPAGYCWELYAPFYDQTALTGQYNYARADSFSHAAYSFRELRRVRAPDGQLDPIERFERENVTGVPTAEARPTAASRTPPAGVTGIFLAVFVAVCWRSRMG
ncbi:MAG TPA: hypothetical protein VGB18_04770 [Candidatus Thermoplasmatota archaeon]